MPKASSKKTYSPSEKEKYMCDKHKKYFTEALQNWKKDIIKTNNLSNILNSSDDNSEIDDNFNINRKINQYYGFVEFFENIIELIEC